MASAASLKLAVVLVVAAAASVNGAPAPSADCSSLIATMADCLSFVSNGSTLQKPQGNCCGGFLTVVETDPGCLCKGFEESAEKGVSLDLAKTKALPPLCRIPTYIIPHCDATPPTGAPAADATPSTTTEADATSSTPTVAANARTTLAPVASAPGPAASVATSQVALSLSGIMIAGAATASWFLI